MTVSLIPRVGLGLRIGPVSALRPLVRTAEASASLRSLSTFRPATATATATSNSRITPLLRRPPTKVVAPDATPTARFSPILTLLRRQSTAAASFSATQAPLDSVSSASSSKSSASSTPLLTRPGVGLHLYALAFLVYAIVIVGGLTRLTESGLSITEWNPGFKGMRLPITNAEWQVEWDKYKLTPEFLLLNHKMTLDDFKTIYMWEWGHRILGRVIGVAFVLPAAFFATRRWVGVGTRCKLAAIAGGIGFQGFLGWFMVKSGLTAPEPRRVQGEGESAAPAEWTPRVSHFRLAAHMGTAFLVYLAMLHTGLSVRRDWNIAHGTGSASGEAMSSSIAQRLANTLNHPLIRSHSRLTKAVAALVFTTAMSGALVAGLDAGLVYNEFPTMGEGRLAPPMHELIDDKYAIGDSRVVPNLTQNPVTVQLVHRTLAITTLCTVLGLAWRTRSLATRYATAAASAAKRNAAVLPTLPRNVTRLAYAAAGVACAQATLGITTLIYLVPIPLASAHQGGSLVLLSVLIAMLAAMRRVPPSVLQYIRLHAASSTPRHTVLQKVLK